MRVPTVAVLVGLAVLLLGLEARAAEVHRRHQAHHQAKATSLGSQHMRHSHVRRRAAHPKKASGAKSGRVRTTKAAADAGTHRFAEVHARARKAHAAPVGEDAAAATPDAIPSAPPLADNAAALDGAAAQDAATRATTEADVLEGLNKEIADGDSVSKDIVKAREDIVNDMNKGIPDASLDMNFAQTLDGVDHIAAGYDISTGEFKLPTLVWREYKNDECEKGKSGRWCDNTAVDKKFYREVIPSAIAVSRESTANSAVARRVFTNTKEMAATEASLFLSAKSPQGALTQGQDVSTLRDVQMHSDIMVARREHKMYALALFPFNRQAKKSAVLKAELLDAFLEREDGSTEHGGTHDEVGELYVPDCVLHDCMLVDEVYDMPNAGCSLDKGVSVQMPTCGELFGSEVSEDNVKLREACKSKFFMPIRESLKTKASSLVKVCETKADVNKARRDGPTNAECKVFGADLGTQCNANDMMRLGQFIKRWGTHFVERASFGGEMEVQVQLSKTRPAGSTSVPGSMGGSTRGSRAYGAVREATDASRRTIRRLADDATSAAFMEPQSASIAASIGENGDDGGRKNKGGGGSGGGGFGGVGGSLDNIMNAMYSSGVELGQDARRDALADAGVENVAVSFTGGTKMPASESGVTRQQVEEWANSVYKAPSLLHQSLGLRPIFELMDHPSIEGEIQARATAAAQKAKKGGDDEEDKDADETENGADVDAGKVKTFAAAYKVRVQRKRRLLENYLRWFLTKSEALGTALDRKAAARSKSEFELRGMNVYVQQWAMQVRAASGAGRDGSGAALSLRERDGASGTTGDFFDRSAVKGGGFNSVAGLGKETGPGLRGLVAYQSDTSARAQEEVAAETMLSYVLAYRKAAENFGVQCASQCRQENEALLRRGVMYGEFHVLDDEMRNEEPHGLSGDRKSRDVTDAKFTLRRSRQRCLDACDEEKKQSVRTSMQIRVREDMDEFLAGAPQESVGDATFELSTAAFFAGVDGACTICNGLVHTVASGQLPALAGGIAEPRDVCRNRLFAATMNDLDSPLTGDFDLDDELDDAQESIIDEAGEGDAATSKKSQASNIKAHGPTVCLGIVAELEDRLRIVLQDHGFAMPRRSRLVDLLRVWRSHTKKTSPRALAYSLCRKFMHCSVDEIPDPEEKRKSKAMEAREEKKAEADGALARLEKKISDIDESVKVLPKAEGKELEEKKKQVRCACSLVNFVVVQLNFSMLPLSSPHSRFFTHFLPP
jgi:hypothetical protein